MIQRRTITLCIGLLLVGSCAKKNIQNSTFTAPSEAKPAAAETAVPSTPPPVADTPRIELQPVDANSIPGYLEDDLSAALAAFKRSCLRIKKLSDQSSMGQSPFAGQAAQWKPACRVASRLNKETAQNARSFFDQQFESFSVSYGNDTEGRFTGYYEASLRASRKRKKPFIHPVYRRPNELVMVEMKDFSSSPRPRRIAGKVVKGRLRPYFTRKEIDDGALAGRGLELFWTDSAVDRLFAQIQGSGIATFANGKTMRIGYSAKNGHAYTAIGRELAKEGAFDKKDMSMQSIRDWLIAHPKKAASMMQRNKAYVFFEIEKRAGAIGAQNVVLTPERSMAVDPVYIPLSAPIFVTTDVPSPNSQTDTMPFKQMVIAQDTGGAIRGPVRGDLFWGAGERAFSIAGRLKSKGRYYLFLPKGLHESLDRPDSE